MNIKQSIIIQFESGIFENCFLYKYDNFQHIETIESNFFELDLSSYKSYCLYFLIPAHLVSSYHLIKQKQESLNAYKARFFQEHANQIVGDLSEQMFFESSADNIIYLIDKSLMNRINTVLSNISCDVVVCSEYHILSSTEKNSLFNYFDRVIFSNDLDEGSACFKDQLSSYFQMIKDSDPSYDPTLLNQDPDLDFAASLNLTKVKNISVTKLHQNFLRDKAKELFNLFSYKFSFSSLFLKSKLSKVDVFLMLGALIILIVSLNFNNYLLSSQANQYKDETTAIFQAIDPTITRIVNPKFQIDQLLADQKTAVQTLNRQELETITTILNVIKKFKVKSISSFAIYPKKMMIELELLNMNIINYKILNSLIGNYQLEILDDFTKINSQGVSGKIRLKFDV